MSDIYLDLTIRSLKRLNIYKEYLQNYTEEKAIKIYSAVWEENLKTKRLDNGTTPIDDLDAMEYSFEKYLKILSQNT